MRRDDRSPDHYRESVDGELREVLEAVRSVIVHSHSDLEETIRYGMLDYPGLANLGAQKNYVAVYVDPGVLARHGKAFAGIDRGKSCLRFRRVEQVDAAALEALFADVRKTRGT
jgi:uncharacterized protein YdhG (YjbR/CyaY superfamily)